MRRLLLPLLLVVVAAAGAAAGAAAAEDPTSLAMVKKACKAEGERLLSRTLEILEARMSVVNHFRGVVFVPLNGTRCPGTNHDLLYELTAALCGPDHDYLVRCQFDQSRDGLIPLLAAVPAVLTPAQRDGWGKCGCRATEAEAAAAAAEAEVAPKSQ
jgi:hypothetical protein